MLLLNNNSLKLTPSSNRHNVCTMRSSLDSSRKRDRATPTMMLKSISKEPSSDRRTTSTMQPSFRKRVEVSICRHSIKHSNNGFSNSTRRAKALEPRSILRYLCLALFFVPKSDALTATYTVKGDFGDTLSQPINGKIYFDKDDGKFKFDDGKNYIYLTKFIGYTGSIDNAVFLAIREPDAKCPKRNTLMEIRGSINELNCEKLRKQLLDHNGQIKLPNLTWDVLIGRKGTWGYTKSTIKFDSLRYKKLGGIYPVLKTGQGGSITGFTEELSVYYVKYGCIKNYVKAVSTNLPTYQFGKEGNYLRIICPNQKAVNMAQLAARKNPTPQKEYLFKDYKKTLGLKICDQDNKVIVTKVSGPAAQMGIKVGSQLLSVGGIYPTDQDWVVQQVKSATEPIKMLIKFDGVPKSKGEEEAERIMASISLMSFLWQGAKEEVTWGSLIDDKKVMNNIEQFQNAGWGRDDKSRFDIEWETEAINMWKDNPTSWHGGAKHRWEWSQWGFTSTPTKQGLHKHDVNLQGQVVNLKARRLAANSQSGEDAWERRHLAVMEQIQSDTPAFSNQACETPHRPRRRLVELAYCALIGLNVFLMCCLAIGVCFVCRQSHSKRHRPQQPIRW